jgi:CheY-like chemotaxis protein
MLTAQRIEAEVAESGPQALELLRNERQAPKPFELAIVDAGMPGMDGFTLAEAMLNDPALRIPVIMMLDHPIYSDIPLCRSLDIQCHVIKPVSRAETERRGPAGLRFGRRFRTPHPAGCRRMPATSFDSVGR